MGPRPPSWCSYSILGLLTACGQDPGTHQVLASTDEGQLEYFVHFEARRPVGIYSDTDLEAGPLELRLEEDDRLVRIHIARASLEAIDPLLDPALIARLELRVTAPCPDCGEICLEPSRARLSLPLPAEAEVTVWADGTFESPTVEDDTFIRKEMRLEVDRPADRCLYSSPHRLERFGAEGVLIDSGDGGLLAIDETRLIHNTSSYIRILTRGFSVADIERRTLLGSELAFPILGGFDIVSSTSTTVRLLLVAHTGESASAQGSVVFEVEGTDAGLRVVRELARVDALLGPVRALSGGGFVAAGGRGTILIAQPGAPLRQYSLGEGFRFTALEATTAAAGRFHLGGGFGLVGEGDLLLGPEAVTLGNLKRGEGLVDSSVVAFRTRPGAPPEEIWAVTRGQGVFRRTGVGEWSPFEIDAPPGESSCTTQTLACGRARLIEILEGIDFGPDGRMFYVPWMCPKIYTYLPTDPCTREVELDGLPRPDSMGITVVHSRDDRIYFVSNREVWSLRL